MEDELKIMKSEPLDEGSGSGLSIVKSEPPAFAGASADAQGSGPGMVSRFIERTPASPFYHHMTGLIPAIQNNDYGAAAHHVAGLMTLGATDIPQALVGQAQSTARNLKEAYSDPNAGQALAHSVYAVPGIGPMLQQGVDDYNNGNYAGVAGAASGMAVPMGDIPMVGRAGERTTTATRGFNAGARAFTRADVNPIASGLAGAAGLAGHMTGHHWLGGAADAAAVGMPMVKAGVRGAKNALEPPPNGSVAYPGGSPFEHPEYPLDIEQPVGGHQSPQTYAGPSRQMPVSSVGALRDIQSGTGSGSGVGAAGDLVTPSHYAGHSNPTAAHALDTKVITQKIPANVNPDSITAGQLNQWRKELGHAPLRQVDEAVRLNQLKQTLAATRSK